MLSTYYYCFYTKLQIPVENGVNNLINYNHYQK